MDGFGGSCGDESFRTRLDGDPVGVGRGVHEVPGTRRSRSRGVDGSSHYTGRRVVRAE